VLADRYIGSNLAHQTARAPANARPDFVSWIEHLEYNIYNLPREALVLYLRVPPREAQELVARKSARAYTKVKQDLQEASLRHLEDAAAMYDQLSRRPNWATIPCFDEGRSSMRPQKDIATEIFAAVLQVLARPLAKEGR
jgi:dTMP kinase